MLIFSLGLLKQTAEGKDKMMFLGLDYWKVECYYYYENRFFYSCEEGWIGLVEYW
jgi:hypothetical protein